jgi:KaiC/GvpD/RAD55 family RecA-like ATPase
MTTTTTTGHRVFTGIDSLDKHVPDGLYSGSIVALVADPTSQSELLLAGMATERPTLYLTLQRTPEAVRRGLARFGVEDDIAVRQLPQDDTADAAREAVTGIDRPTTVIVDPMNAMERGDVAALSTFLNEAADTLVDVGGLLIAYCLRDSRSTDGRLTTTYMADVVFDLETDSTGEMIENHLVVPKVRGGSPVHRAIKLELTDEVRVDTSRDIS